MGEERRKAPESTPSEHHNQAGTENAGPDNAGGENADRAIDEDPAQIDLDRPPQGLPELSFPISPLREAREAAAARRSRRLRVEFVGGGILLLVGMVASAVTQAVAILVLAILVLGCLVAYELLVSNLE